MERDRLVGRQRPRGGGPDDDLDRLVDGRDVEAASELDAVGHREADVDRRRGLVLVLDLGLGECRAAVDAPVHRLGALVEVAGPLDLPQHAQGVGLELEVHGAVGVVPVAQHAQADEVGLLPFDLFGGIGAAQLAEFRWRNVLAVGLLDLQFDRQAVAVPARHVGGVEAGQRLGLDDDVLEDLVHRMADVDVAVGVGRAVVQDELGPAGGGLADRLVAFLLLPALHPAGLALGEVAPHRERGVGQVERVLVVRHGAGLYLILARNCLAFSTSRRICATRLSRSGYFSSSRSLCRKSTRTRRP